MLRRGVVLADRPMHRRIRDKDTASLLRKQFAHARKMRATDNKTQMRMKIQVENALQTMRKTNHDVGEQTISVAITTLGKIGLLQTSEELFESSKKLRETSKERDPTLFNSILISRILNSHPSNITQAVKKTFSEMKAELIQPDLITFNTALKGVQQLLSKSKQDTTDSAMQLKEYILSQMSDIGIAPDHVTYNSLLSCSCPKTVELIISEFEKSGELPTISSYHAVISMYVRHDMFDLAEKWLRKTCIDKMSDLICFSTYIQGCERGSLDSRDLVNKLENAYDMILSEKLIPSLEVHHLLMIGYSRNGDFENVSRQYKKILSQKLSPTYRTYSIFIDSVAMKISSGSDTQKYIDIAEAAFSQGMQDGVINNKRPYESLAKLYRAAGEYEKATAIANGFNKMMGKLGRSEILEQIVRKSHTALNKK